MSDYDNYLGNPADPLTELNQLHETRMAVRTLDLDRAKVYRFFRNAQKFPVLAMFGKPETVKEATFKWDFDPYQGRGKLAAKMEVADTASDITFTKNTGVQVVNTGVTIGKYKDGGPPLTQFMKGDEVRIVKEGEPENGFTALVSGISRTATGMTNLELVSTRPDHVIEAPSTGSDTYYILPAGSSFEAAGYIPGVTSEHLGSGYGCVQEHIAAYGEDEYVRNVELRPKGYKKQGVVDKRRAFDKIMYDRVASTLLGENAKRDIREMPELLTLDGGVTGIEGQEYRFYKKNGLISTALYKDETGHHYGDKIVLDGSGNWSTVAGFMVNMPQIFELNYSQLTQAKIQEVFKMLFEDDDESTITGHGDFQGILKLWNEDAPWVSDKARYNYKGTPNTVRTNFNFNASHLETHFGNIDVCYDRFLEQHRFHNYIILYKKSALQRTTLKKFCVRPEVQSKDHRVHMGFYQVIEGLKIGNPAGIKIIKFV